MSNPSGGGCVGQQYAGLGVFAAADAEQLDKPNALDAAFRGAREL